jgi:DNA-binding transcriptional LysR family regulator
MVMQPPYRPLNFHHLEVFYAVARHLNFSRAAEELYISQPAVSKHIKDLEKDLGVDLFRRDGRRVELTDAGRLVYDYAAHALVLTEGLRRALAELHGPGRGHLRLAATYALATYVVPRVLAAFQARYPDVELSLQVSNKGTAVRQVLQHHVDLGIIDSQVIPTDVQWQRFARVPIVLLSSPNHHFYAGGTVDLMELSQETIIAEEKGSDIREAVEQELERLRVRPARVLEIGNIEAIKRAVTASLGVAFLPRICVAGELSRGDLVQLVVQGFSLEAQLGVVFAKGRPPSPIALAFVALLQKTTVAE